MDKPLTPSPKPVTPPPVTQPKVADTSNQPQANENNAPRVPATPEPSARKTHSVDQATAKALEAMTAAQVQNAATQRGEVIRIISEAIKNPTLQNPEVMNALVEAGSNYNGEEDFDADDDGLDITPEDRALLFEAFRGLSSV